MPFHADEIADKEFVPSFRGYNRDEVRAFLRAVSVEQERLAGSGERQLVEELRAALATQIELLDNQADTTPSDEFLELVREVLDLQADLVISQRTATKRLEEASGLLGDALSELRWATSQLRRNEHDTAGHLTNGMPAPSRRTLRERP